MRWEVEIGYVAGRFVKTGTYGHVARTALLEIAKAYQQR